jgi:hypothetical protein
MTVIALTGADLADLAAALSFTTLDEDGEEVLIDGREFSTEQVARLADGDEVCWDGYLLSAPQGAWAGHRSPTELMQLQHEQGHDPRPGSR